MRAFQAFTYSRLTPWLITPCLTLARTSQPDNLHFPPVGESHPSRLRAFHLSSDVGESLPTTQLELFRLYLSDTASLDLPSDAGEVLPARQPYLFKPLALWGLPVWHSESWSPVGRRRGAPGQTTLPFPSRGRRDLPSRLRVFTFRRMSARATRPRCCIFGRNVWHI